MEIAAGLAGLLSVLVSCFVGVRLVLLARRTGHSPELLIGLDLILVGGAWNALIAVGRQATGLPDELRAALVCAGALSAVAGTACLMLFTWQTFRPSRAGALTALFLSLLLAGLFAAQSITTGWLAFATDERGPWTNASLFTSINYVWACFESMRHASMLSRRVRLGLADPVVADRVRLFATLMATGTLASWMFAGFQAFGIAVGGTTIGLSFGAAVCLFSVALLWLAFMPPASYLESVRRRAVVEA
jgi:hypothetical protein